MLKPRFKVRRLKSFDDYPPTVWHQLCAAGESPVVFLTLSWLRTWWNVFGRGELLLIAVEVDGRPIALAPLFCEAGMIFFVGAGSSDYLDFLGNLEAPEVLDLLMATARDGTPGFLGFRLHHVPDGSSTGARLQHAAKRLGFDSYDEGGMAAPRLCFADWPDNQRRPEEKKSLVRHERTFLRQGPLEVEHCRDAEIILPQLDSFFEQHVGRWANTEFPSLFDDDEQRRFYQALVRDHESSDWLRFTRVTWHGGPIAYHFGSCFQGVYLWYKPSFEIRMARHSPGEVLIRHLLIAARTEGAKAFDFGIGDEPFKQRFATANHRIRTWGLYPRGTSHAQRFEAEE